MSNSLCCSISFERSDMHLTFLVHFNQAEGVLSAGTNVTALIVDDLRKMPIAEDITMS